MCQRNDGYTSSLLNRLLFLWHEQVQRKPFKTTYCSQRVNRRRRRQKPPRKRSPQAKKTRGKARAKKIQGTRRKRLQFSKYDLVSFLSMKLICFMAFSWSKLQFHHVTDTLLTIIEENPRYRQAFGFSK